MKGSTRVHDRNLCVPKVLNTTSTFGVLDLDATLSQMNNLNFDSRKGKNELDEHGKNQCEKPY